MNINRGNVDFADDILRSIENEYGQKIERIAHMKELGFHEVELLIVFTDYRVLKALVGFEMDFGTLSITIQGKYF